MKKVISAILGVGVNIIIYALAIFVLFRAGAFAYDFSYEVFGEPVVSEYADEEVRIVIEAGDGGRDIAKKLNDKGVITSEAAFIIKARLSNASMKPGTYVVKANMSADDMMELMSDDANSVVKPKTAEELEAETAESQEGSETESETDGGDGGQ